ncbi:MAG: hypothetical protein WAX89_05135 [Alphaproteobacteria bacterium]
MTLLTTGRVFLIGEALDEYENGDIRIMPPRDIHLKPAGNNDAKYGYTRAEVYIIGTWLPYGLTIQKGLQHWRTDGGNFTAMRMHLFAAVLATIREPFELHEDSVFAPVDLKRLRELSLIADMLLYKDVTVTERKPSA